MKLKELSLILRTLRYLRLKQISFRTRYLLRRNLPKRFRTELKRLPAEIEWAPLKPYTPFLTYAWLNAKEISGGCFRFLNETAEYGSNIDWTAPERDRLWKYNLHYFQFLHTKGTLNDEAGLRLIRQWIDNNPPGAKDAWDPYPVSLRIVNWMKYLSSGKLSGSDSPTMIRSLYTQTLSLEHSLEWHLLGNHLLKNAKALLFAGLFFQGDDAERWLKKGLELLSRELEEQILSDGGHFERSPMYHSMILEDCLDLLNIGKIYQNRAVRELCAQLEKIIPDMVRFLKAVSHPDSRIALFNDAAFNIEAPPKDLINYCLRVLDMEIPEPKEIATAFPESGYFIMSPAPEDRLLIDCGKIGPDYQTGHAHCDTLSFELSLKGKRVVVDSGCFQYIDSPIRRLNRGNAGHNTLTIDGRDQSEVWGAHRCARRAYPKDAHLEILPDGTLFFQGAHDGYRRLAGSPVHHRSIRWKDHVCIISDRVEGEGFHNIELRLHIHPLLNIDHSKEDVVIRDNRDVLVIVSLNGEGQIEKSEGRYCPEFGKKDACVVLIAKYNGVQLPFEGGWIFTSQ